MKKSFLLIVIILSISLNSYCQTNNLRNLFQLSNAQTRSISPENFTGEKGKGGMATLEEGSAAKAAKKYSHQTWRNFHFGRD